jgi:hypothetical protein
LGSEPKYERCVYPTTIERNLADAGKATRVRLTADQSAGREDPHKSGLFVRDCARCVPDFQVQAFVSLETEGKAATEII